MILPNLVIAPTVEMGRGVFAMTDIHRDTVVEVSPVIVMSREDVFADAWMGFVVPARTPAPVVKRLQDAIAQVLADPQLREKLRAQYMDVVASTPAEFRAVMQADVERWRPVIEKNHITLD